MIRNRIATTTTIMMSQTMTETPDVVGIGEVDVVGSVDVVENVVAVGVTETDSQ
jgi:hypothetical protein